VTTALAVSGGILFFVVCQWKFGQWNLYMVTQEEFWGSWPNYRAFFDPNLYSLFWPSQATDLSRFSVPLVVAAFAVIGIVESVLVWFRQSKLLLERLGLYVAAGAMFYISVAGSYSRSFSGLLRYELPIAVVLVLAFATIASQLRVKNTYVRIFSLFSLTAILIVFLNTQEWLITLFSQGDWGGIA
jgi:hypothetical protein